MTFIDAIAWLGLIVAIVHVIRTIVHNYQTAQYFEKNRSSEMGLTNGERMVIYNFQCDFNIWIILSGILGGLWLLFG